MTTTTSAESGINHITFTRSAEQQEIVGVARDFAQKELRPAADALQRAMSEEGMKAWKPPMELIAKAASAGLLTFAIPEQYGGGGFDSVTCAMIAEELAAGDAGLGALLGSAQLFAAGILLSDMDEGVRQHWLERLCRPEGAIGAIAFSEPNAGSDVGSIRTMAVRDGDEWVLNGEKTWITGGGPFAEAILVFARTGEPGPGGITAFIVPGDSAGLAHTKLDLLGLRTSYTSSIFLSDVRVPHENIVGGVDGGFLTAMRFFGHSRPQVAASGVGIARAAFEYAVKYANEREAFGKPIITKQGVSFLLADMGMRIEAARALTWRACDTVNRGEDVGLIGAYAKAFATDTAMSVTTDAVQVMGGAGLSADHPVERWMRDAKVLQIVEGTNQVQRLIASRYYSQGVVSVP